MNTNKISRRIFFERTAYLSVIPTVFSSILYSSVYGETGKGIPYIPSSPISAVPDLERISSFLKLKDPLKWVFTGDSITHGAKHTGGYRSYPEVFSERIRWEMARTRDIVINTGISGNTAQNILNDFDWRIGQFNPQVVSLMIGTNDCSIKRDISIEQFEQDLDSLLTRIRELNAIPVYHTPSIIIKEKAREREKISEYVSVIQSLCSRKEVILIDNYTYWQNAMQQYGETTIFKNWLNDPIHPNGAGHSEIARLMFKELSIFDPQASTCGGLYYEGDH